MILWNEQYLLRFVIKKIAIDKRDTTDLITFLNSKLHINCTTSPVKIITAKDFSNCKIFTYFDTDFPLNTDLQIYAF
jgi:hypothetical protein